MNKRKTQPQVVTIYAAKQMDELTVEAGELKPGKVWFDIVRLDNSFDQGGHFRMDIYPEGAICSSEQVLFDDRPGSKVSSAWASIPAGRYTLTLASYFKDWTQGGMKWADHFHTLNVLEVK